MFWVAFIYTNNIVFNIRKKYEFDINENSIENSLIFIDIYSSWLSFAF